MPDAEFVGYGGPKMREAGARLLYPLVNLAVMWFLNVFLNIITFIRLIIRADRYFRDVRPDAVILIDYPGLHWWIAKRAKARGIPGLLLRSAPALGLGRLAREEGQAIRGPGPVQPAVRARLVQGPWRRSGRIRGPSLLRRAQRARAGRGVPGPGQRGPRAAIPLVAILPGSRTQELTRNLPIMVRAAAKLARHRPATRFAVACLHERHRVLAERIVKENTPERGKRPRSRRSRSTPRAPPS